MPRSAFRAVKTALQLNLPVHSNVKDIVRNYLQDRSCRSDPEPGPTLALQCLDAARRCGDVLQADLWAVASFYLDYFANREPILRLDTVFDLYCDSVTYRHMATERAALYQSKPRAYEHTRQLTRDHLLLNDKDKVPIPPSKKKNPLTIRTTSRNTTDSTKRNNGFCHPVKPSQNLESIQRFYDRARLDGIRFWWIYRDVVLLRFFRSSRFLFCFHPKML